MYQYDKPNAIILPLGMVMFPYHTFQVNFDLVHGNILQQGNTFIWFGTQLRLLSAGQKLDVPIPIISHPPGVENTSILKSREYVISSPTKLWFLGGVFNMGEGILLLDVLSASCIIAKVAKTLFCCLVPFPNGLSSLCSFSSSIYCT